MGRISGIQIKNYGSLKNVKLGKLLFDSKEKELTNMNAIIGQSGTGKSTLINILLQDSAIQERYTILKLDLNQSRNCCIRNIFSQIFGIYSTDSTPDDQVEADQMVLNFFIKNMNCHSMKLLNCSIYVYFLEN